MKGFESFSPSPQNRRAQDEEKERKSLRFHNRGLHDEEGSEGVEEASGKREATAPTDGADESRSIKKIKKVDASSDLMGSVPDKLPDDPAQLAKWVEKEKQRLEKQKGLKKAA